MCDVYTDDLWCPDAQVLFVQSATSSEEVKATSFDFATAVMCDEATVMAFAAAADQAAQCWDIQLGAKSDSSGVYCQRAKWSQRDACCADTHGEFSSAEDFDAKTEASLVSAFASVLYQPTITQATGTLHPNGSCKAFGYPGQTFAFSVEWADAWTGIPSFVCQPVYAELELAYIPGFWG